MARQPELLHALATPAGTSARRSRAGLAAALAVALTLVLTLSACGSTTTDTAEAAGGDAAEVSAEAASSEDQEPTQEPTDQAEEDVEAVTAVEAVTPEKALSAAVIANDGDGVVAALADGADPNAEVGSSPLILVATLQHAPAAIAPLVEAGADVNVRTSNGGTPLLHAAEAGDVEMVQALLDAGADVNATRNGFPTTALHAASATDDNFDVLPVLIENGIDIDVLDMLGDPAISTASYFGAPQSLQYLIDHGADISIVGSDDNTALGWAIDNGQQETADILRAAGATE